MGNKELVLNQLEKAAAGVTALGTKIDANGATSDDWLQLMQNEKASSYEPKNALGTNNAAINELENNGKWRWLDA